MGNQKPERDSHRKNYWINNAMSSFGIIYFLFLTWRFLYLVKYLVPVGLEIRFDYYEEK
jgi:hypothetical protein